MQKNDTEIGIKVGFSTESFEQMIALKTSLGAKSQSEVLRRSLRLYKTVAANSHNPNECFFKDQNKKFVLFLINNDSYVAKSNHFRVGMNCKSLNELEELKSTVGTDDFSEVARRAIRLYHKATFHSYNPNICFVKDSEGKMTEIVFESN